MNFGITHAYCTVCTHSITDQSINVRFWTRSLAALNTTIYGPALSINYLTIVHEIRIETLHYYINP